MMSKSPSPSNLERSKAHLPECKDSLETLAVDHDGEDDVVLSVRMVENRIILVSLAE